MTLLHLQLFWGESQQTFLGLDELPELAELSLRQKSDLHAWYSTRRKILKHEAHSQPWVKVTAASEAIEIALTPSGSATAQCLFGTGISAGSWNIQDGVLFIQLQDEQTLWEYRVVGNALSNIHSAAEYINGKPHGMVKLIQVKPR